MSNFKKEVINVFFRGRSTQINNDFSDKFIARLIQQYIIGKYNIEYNEKQILEKYREMFKNNTRPRYTSEEDDIIVKNARLYITNLRLSFRVSSLEIYLKTGRVRDKKSVENRYYYHLKKKRFIFANESSNGEQFINVKNTIINKKDTAYDVISKFKLNTLEDKDLLIKTIYK